jgi:hypothetical protein
MSDKKKEQTVDEESFEAGRVLGLLRRKSPELYDEIVAIAKQEGKKPGEVIEEAFALYRDYKYMIGVDPRALAYAMRIVQVFQRWVIEMMVFSTQYLNQLMGLDPQRVADIVVERVKQELSLGEEEKAKAEKAKLSPNIREKLVELTTNTMIQMIESMMSNMARMYLSQPVPRAMAPSQPTPQPTPQQTQQQAQQYRSIKIVDSEEEGSGEGQGGEA